MTDETVIRTSNEQSLLAKIREDCGNTAFDWPSNSTDRSVPPERVIYSGDAILHAAWHRAKLLRMLDAKQAKIDALMLEYCPDEMTDAQREEWGKHQRPSHETSDELSRLRTEVATLRGICAEQLVCRKCGSSDVMPWPTAQKAGGGE